MTRTRTYIGPERRSPHEDPNIVHAPLPTTVLPTPVQQALAANRNGSKPRIVLDPGPPPQPEEPEQDMLLTIGVQFRFYGKKAQATQMLVELEDRLRYEVFPDAKILSVNTASQP